MAIASLSRLGLWAFLALWAIIDLGLTAGWIAKEKDDFGSYLDSSAALLSFSLFAFLIALVYTYAAFAVASFGIVTALYVETAVVAVLWIMFLAGSAAFTDKTDNLGSCSDFAYYQSFCHLAKAIQAFSWMIWIALTALLVILAYAGFRSRRWAEHTSESLDGDRPIK